MDITSNDWAIRAAAFRHLRRLSDTRDHLTADDLRAGFMFEGRRVPFINPQRGIFKPKEMEALLSIRTVYPKRGGKIWYDDQRHVHDQIYAGEDAIDYSFMGTDADAAENRWLREAFERRVPIVYFLGVSPGRYQAVLPAFIADWDRSAAKAKVAFGDPASLALPRLSQDLAERRYALRIVKQRLHQANFRDAVIAAYRGRCALSNLPEPLLLDAAHIISDGDEEFGQPVVPNGIPLSKIHHAAFDAHLIGIDPDCRVHVSKRLLLQRDGPVLESIKNLDGALLHLPVRVKDHPDPERLRERFELFRAAA